MKKLTLPFGVKKPILACGADLKGAFALAKGRAAYLFSGFGDLADLENFTKYEKAVRAAAKKLKIYPQIVVCDLHPGYFSTRFAESYRKNTIFRAQHHEAHIAGAIVDNGIKGDVLGVAFDGTGYGLDGNIWGGEFFTGNVKCFKRAAHLGYVPMPGGEMCIKEPWRMAASYIYYKYKNGDGFIFSGRSSGKKNEPVPIFQSSGKKNEPVPIFHIFQMIEKNINSPMTSSAGRLFDAVGSLILNKEHAGFEAELPMELEKIIDKNEYGRYDFELEKIDGVVSIDVSKAIKGILKDIDNKVPGPKISAKFHNTAAFIILEMAKRLNFKKVVLSGGVFQNKFLSHRAQKLLKERGFKVYMHSNVEANDSGIPIGQIAIANARVSICA